MLDINSLAYLTPLILILVVVGWYLYNHRDMFAVFYGGVSILSRYSRDLTQAAREGKLDPVIGREEEISRVIQILSRRTKNNPVLIGRAGIGKTAIVEGLAHAIADRDVPSILYHKKVLALDLTGILAGTKYRGEFEDRLKRIIDEISAAKRSIILFIDEIHALSQAGEAEGAIDAADILKPMLARGELQMVGATTKEEYEKYIKEDKTLDRRLQPIFVAESSPADTKKILQGIKQLYEKYHDVKITDKAINESISQTKSISHRSYPDKAIDALDEACSRVRLKVVQKGNPRTDKTVKSEDVKAVVNLWKKNK